MNQGADNLRVLIVADDPLVRAGLAAILGVQPPIAVAGSASSDEGLAAALAAFAPDTVVWDLGWEPGAHIDVLSRFCDEHGLPVVALLSNGAAGDEVRAAGAAGLLGRTASAVQIAAAVVAAVNGLHVYDAGLLPPPLQPAAPAAPAAAAEPLSNRELDVLRGLAEGLSNKQIARSLGISEHTVKFHINAIMGKLGAQSRTEAVVRATRAGLILL